MLSTLLKSEAQTREAADSDLLLTELHIKGKKKTHSAADAGF